MIVNAAAHTAVDKAESRARAGAYAINAEAPAVLAREAAAANAWLVHYSTDYVFDGSGEQPWTEDDPTGPLERVRPHASSKASSACAPAGCRHLILRTSWVYSAARRQLSRERCCSWPPKREQLNVVADQVGAPTGADLLADVTRACLAQRAGCSPSLAGTYHVAAAGETSWHGYAQHGDRVGAAHAACRCAWLPSAIAPVPSTAYPTPRTAPAELAARHRSGCSAPLADNAAVAAGRACACWPKSHGR